MTGLVILAVLIYGVYSAAKKYNRYIDEHPEDDSDLFI